MKTNWNGYRAKTEKEKSELTFLLAFYDHESPTYQQITESAEKAGYAHHIAARMGSGIINRYREKGFREIADFLGINRVTIGLALRRVMTEGNDRDVITAARLLLSNMGEITDATNQKGNVTTVNMPTIVYMGQTSGLLKALKGHGKEKVLDVQAKVPALNAGDASGNREASS